MSDRRPELIFSGKVASPGLAARAGELGAWASANDGAGRAADLVEQLAAR